MKLEVTVDVQRLLKLLMEISTPQWVDIRHEVVEVKAVITD